MRTVLLAWAILFAAVTGAFAAAADGTAVRRVAMIIGNGTYAIGDLPNPRNDADLVAGAFRRLGFDVHQAADLTTPGFEAFFQEVAPAAKAADVLFVYYAGHAFQYKGDNRLLMTDARADSLDTILAHSLSLGDLVGRLGALAPRALVLALDSCRNNPFVAGQKDAESGLSYLETGDGQVMIAYATSAGQVAYDGYGPNSPYSIALSNALLSADARERTLSDVFREVRRDVREATNGMQIPWVSSSIEEEIRIRPATGAPPAPTVVASADLPALEEVLWYFARSSGDPEDLRTYVELFPRGTYVAEARSVAERDATVVRAVFAEGGGGAASARTPGETIYASTGDRSPPEELRVWPEKLPDAAGGLGSLSDLCDRLAADPDDPARLAPGVQMGLVDVRGAVKACVAALVADPDRPQAIFQLGRALDVAGLQSWARAYYRTAADRGYGAAMVNLGYLYKTGRGVDRDDAKALELYRRAAMMGNPRGRTNLGSMYRDGAGVAQDFGEAILWYRLAGANGWPNAIDALANLYAKGQGVEKSPEKAFELYRAAAIAGQTNAMNNCGRAYLQGVGVAENRAEGLRWLERAVAAGNRFAAQSLGRALLKEDPDRALELFTLSAERGFDDARLDLAKLLKERGKASAAEALYQLRLAEALGVKKAAELRPAYEKPLSDRQRADVDARVRAWVANNGD